MGSEASRAELVKGLWPDKALYGSTLLLITAGLGALQGLALSLVDVTTSGGVGAFIETYPAWLTLVLSLAAGVLAIVSLRARDTKLAAWGCACGVAAFPLAGAGSILALVAGIFVLLSRMEGEDVNPDTADLDAEMWPDKALAASTVLTVVGVITIGWGGILAADAIEFEGYTNDSVAFGWAAIVVGLVNLGAAVLVYRQRGALVGVLAAIGGVFALGMYVIGPILALAALVLIWMAWREDEFKDRGADAAAGSA